MLVGHSEDWCSVSSSVHQLLFLFCVVIIGTVQYYVILPLVGSQLGCETSRYSSNVFLYLENDRKFRHGYYKTLLRNRDVLKFSGSEGFRQWGTQIRLSIIWMAMKKLSLHLCLCWTLRITVEGKSHYRKQKRRASTSNVLKMYTMTWGSNVGP